MKNQKKSFVWIFCLVFLLAGCVNADVHITIHKDGSGIYQIKVLSNEWMLPRLEKTKNQLRDQGFQIREISSSSEQGWIATKKIASILDEPPEKSLQAISHAFASSPAMKKDHSANMVEIRNRIFTTSIIYRNVIDLTDQFNRHQASQWFLQQVNLQFHLTTPLRAREHNAATVQDDGKTLTWDIDPAKPNPIYVMYRIPNPITWSIILLIAAAGLVMAIIYRFRRKQRTKRTGDSSEEPPVSFRWDKKY
ncbi:MAG: DUF3153 domain-containing protein [Thermoactinomyces sp.]